MLAVDDYHRAYLRRMLPAMDYYYDIYYYCCNLLAQRMGKDVAHATLVDYGGGHGLLSVVAKQLGWHQVVYIDIDTQAVTTASALADAVGLGPDVMLTGDSETLKRWMLEQGENPDAVAGMDVIEHVYCLDDLFCNLLTLPHAAPQLVFTTASNPYNRLLCHKLRRCMRDDETGTAEQPNFFTLRYDYIRSCFPEMTHKEASRWATQTRGLIYEDIRRAVEHDSPNLLADPYNTCDPRTGSWTERILPIADYEALLQPYGYELQVLSGWHNAHQGGIKGAMARFLNRKQHLGYAPFIVLHASPKTAVTSF